MEQIRRIEEMEAIYDRACRAFSAPEPAVASYPSLEGDLRRLEAYYTGGLWLQDYLDDEAGRLPGDLKRGVLSQDGINDLLDKEMKILSALGCPRLETGEN